MVASPAKVNLHEISWVQFPFLTVESPSTESLIVEETEEIKGQWMKDSDVESCPSCSQKFSVVKRKVRCQFFF